ncbi:MAG: gliding motility-associated C-terminal domain-containing protein, partial [Bergeyella sp.]|nr:gliding motility-associated C-terminal domain-containing protein [Bergeyella sp.]
VPYDSVGGVVYVRVENGLTGCYSVADLRLQVNKRPRIERGFVLESCDLGDGKGRFDLRSARVTSEEGMVLRYYVTRSGAMSGDLAEEIDGSVPYDSVGGVVYVRVENGLTGCYSVADLRLQVNKRPRIERGFVYTGCDTDFKGYIEVTLSDITPQILKDAEKFEVKYYDSKFSAMLGGDDNLPNKWRYAEDRKVYMRVNSLDGCPYVMESIDFKLGHRLPIEKVEKVSLCSKDPNETSKLLSLSDYVRFFTTDVSVRVRYYDNLWKAQKGREDLGSSWVEAKKGITEYYFRFDKYGVCPQIGRLSIEVKVPERSEILKDQKICTGYTTRLDAGEGFDSYRWSTGATDSSITNVGVGDYWVDLTRNGCTYRQNVQVREVSSPRIGSVSVKDKTVTVEVAGGVPPYEYSLDEVVWQTSNVFHNLYDGNYMIYVRDSSKCNYVTKSHFTIFSLINTITPNGDGFNDYLDYSHLSHKRNFQFYIYDRYGTEIFKGDMFNRYIWDGTIRGRTVSTATYWYTISWSEGSSDTLIRLSSWLLVKNR